MSLFKYRDDGSIDIEPNFPLTSGFLKKWKQDPNDCRHFIPDFPICNHLNLKMERLSCGKIYINWNCIKFKNLTSVENCKNCVTNGKNK